MEQMELEMAPTEVLIEVLSLLPAADLKNLGSISARLDKIINEGIGVKVAIGQPTQYSTIQSFLLDEPEKVLRKGVSSCHVADLLETIADPKFSFPKIVKKLYFEGPITELNFHSLLVPLSGLQYLSLHFTALSSPGLIVSDKFFSKCILKTLTIFSKQCKRAMRHPNLIGNDSAIAGNITRFTDNCIAILTNLKSSRLNTLLLSLPLLSTAEKKLTFDIFQCIFRHGSTLKNFQLYWDCVYDPPAAAVAEEESPTGSRYVLELEGQHLIPWSDFSAPELKRFSYFSAERSKSLFMPQWGQFIQSQKKLEEFFYFNRCQIDTNKPVIFKRLGPEAFQELKKVLIHLNARTKMEYEEVNLTDVDCAVFQGCPNLTHLLFRGEATRIPLERPSVANIRMLPKLISILSIRDALLKKVDGEAILGLDKLQKLRLLNTGCTGEFGLSLKNLFQIIDERKIKEVEFTKSVNLDESESGRVDLMHTCISKMLRIVNKFHTVLDKDQSSPNQEESSPKYYEVEKDMFSYAEGTDLESIRANDVCNLVFK